MLSTRPFTRPFSAAPACLRCSSLLALLAFLLLASGCTHTGQAPQPVTGLALAGRVQGGQQPVTGSTLQLYVVGTTADGAASSPLLNKSVQTDATGSFSITGDYTCPSSTALVYLTASGGNPGLAAGSNNPNLTMMAALGQCGQLSATTYIFINEVTTVGTVAALYPYMNSSTAVGSGTADLNAFTTAFSTVNEFTNIAAGTAPGPALPGGFYASSSEIDTLGNILAPCINSTGGVAGDGSLCGQLFQLTKPTTSAAPTDTVGAILDILRNPTQNVAALFNLSQPAPPFQPALTSAPTDWTLTIVPVPATPTFSLAAGTYTGAQTLSLSDSVAGAQIFYTTDGSTPSKSSTLYSGAFTVASSETVKAIAIEGGRSSSAVASAAYTINSSTGIPVITSVSAVAAQQTQTITINGTGFGSRAAYTGNSSFISFRDATTGVQAGYGSDSVTLVISSWTDSQIVLGGFAGAYGGSYSLSPGDQIQLNLFNPQTGSGPGACNNIFVGGGATVCSAVSPAATPVFSPAGGSYTSSQTVTLTDATSGAQIYYTTDGSTPTISSTLYGGPITVASSKVLKAYAFAFGYSASAVATATYDIGSSAGIISTFAGSGVQGNTGDGGLATSARLTSPYQMCLDPAGDILVADYSGNRIRKITPAGMISTFAGTGASSSTGDGGQAAAASINAPNGIACDTSGNVYIAEEHGIRVRKVNAAGVISTFAGTGVQGYAGDGGLATSAGFVLPEGVAVDTSGNVYIADAYGNRIRKVNTAGIISTFAGTGTGGYNGDGLQATVTTLSTPYAVLPDNAGNVYISDSSNNRVRKVNAGGIVSTYAGNGSSAFAGDGGQATSASISGALGITLDSAGNLYIADQNNYRIRKVTAAGVISTVAGNGIQGYSGDGGLATAAEVKVPEGVLIDAIGNLYIGDGANYVIRKVTYFTAVQAATPTFSPAAGTYTSAQAVALSSTTTGASIYYTLDGSIPTAASAVYAAPLTVSASETINAIAVAGGYTNSTVGTAAYTINTPIAAAPTASPAGGTFTTPPTITLADTTPGAAIHYTVDGSSPTAGSPLYTVPFTLPASAVVSTIAVAPGYLSSYPNSFFYTINNQVASAPTFSINPGTYTAPQTVQLSTSTAGATIYYTLDGSNPSPSSTKYTGAITVSTSETINAITTAPNYTTSAPSSATYTIVPPVIPRITSVGAFLSGKTQTVVITGSGFGNTGPTSATSSQFRLRDNTNVWEAGYSPTPDVVGVGFSSWTDTQIVFTGFVGSYGSQNWTINPGDNLTITIWNANGSGACSNIYVGAGPTTCQ